ncbi:MAG: FesM, partial [Anaerolineae bacterium]|nr:FesM [Anaerolineae bacterium]
MTQDTGRLDLLSVPVLGRFLASRHARMAMQTPLLLLAILVVFDGLFGPQLAPKNLATVLVWVHYRGLVVMALLLAGNLFCMACPFM